MRITAVMWMAAAVVALPGIGRANHLDCARAWAGTPTEATRAWSECKERDAAEHVQMFLEQQRREEAQREREYQRAMEERRVRALEEAARAQRDAADAANTPQQTTCGWEYSLPQGNVWVCRKRLAP